MKFGDLIANSLWLSVETVFSKIYPDELDYLDDYANVFDQLKYLNPKESNITIIISNEIDCFDNEQYVSVSGYDDSKKEMTNNLTESLALEFTPWDEWLGMNIDHSSLRYFSSYEIICHCLQEMTFMGFNQEEIKNELDKIKEVADDYKNMTEEEKNIKSISLDDLMKEFEQDNK
jgi:uncharacterized membrane protein